LRTPGNGLLQSVFAMNLKRWILLGAAIGAAIIAGWIFWSPKPISKPAASLPPKDEGAEPMAISAANEANPRNTSPTPLAEDGPIVFYGKLEDQAANPVPYASVVANKIYHDGSAELSERLFAKSDDNGFFQIDAGSGESIEIVPRAPGYALASTNNVAIYRGPERARPDPTRPVIIKMWKLQGAEPLATFDARYPVRPGSPIYFDFVTQTIVPSYVDFRTQQVVPSGGDLKITVNRSPGVVSQENRPDWSVELETTGPGGLIEVTPKIWATTYWAPPEGYQPKQSLRVSGQTGSNWSPKIERRFFVQTRDGGVYTKLFFKVTINRNPTEPAEVTLSGVANTNGSCNWEGDPDTLKHD
jgi:hypothetical protein